MAGTNVSALQAQYADEHVVSQEDDDYKYQPGKSAVVNKLMRDAKTFTKAVRKGKLKER